MTNFQIVTQNPDKLDQLLSMVQDDALEAKGCSYELQMPREWKQWLEQETDLDICETARGCIYPNVTFSEQDEQPAPEEEKVKPSHAVWYDVPCPACGAERTNSWEKKICKSLGYKNTICESCVAKEYGVTIDELRATMEKHYGLVPCLGL